MLSFFIIWKFWEKKNVSENCLSFSGVMSGDCCNCLTDPSWKSVFLKNKSAFVCFQRQKLNRGNSFWFNLICPATPQQNYFGLSTISWFFLHDFPAIFMPATQHYSLQRLGPTDACPTQSHTPHLQKLTITNTTTPFVRYIFIFYFFVLFMYTLQHHSQFQLRNIRITRKSY